MVESVRLGGDDGRQGVQSSKISSELQCGIVDRRAIIRWNEANDV